MLVKEKTALSLRREAVAQFLILASLAVILPAFIHVQWLTGPIINAILFLAVSLLGLSSALFIGLFPSVMALSFGLLPLPLAPMVPFIMLSNAFLAVVFDALKKNYWQGVIVASLVKFLFLYGSSLVILRLLLKKDLALKVTQILSWPQLLTALAGGIIAYGVLKFLRKKDV